MRGGSYPSRKDSFLFVSAIFKNARQVITLLGRTSFSGFMIRLLPRARKIIILFTFHNSLAYQKFEVQEWKTFLENAG